MKKTLLAITILFTAALMTSCKNSSTATPTGALKAMGEATKVGDFKELAKHLCKPDREMMEKMMPMMEELSKKMGKDLKETMKENMGKNDQFNLSDVEFKNEKVNGDNATVEVFNKKKNKTETITLKKEEGSWKICMGVADKMNAEIGSGNFEEKMNKAKEAMKNITPEQMKATQEAMKEAMKNVTPEQMEQAKKLMESMKKQ